MDYTTPVNIPRSTHYGSNYYEFLSRKLKRTVRAFSSLEYWNQICLEMDYQVEKYCEQPLEAEVYYDGKTYKTVFDIWVKYRDAREEFQKVKMQLKVEVINKSPYKRHGANKMEKHIL